MFSPGYRCIVLGKYMGAGPILALHSRPIPFVPPVQKTRDSASLFVSLASSTHYRRTGGLSGRYGNSNLQVFVLHVRRRGK